MREIKFRSWDKENERYFDMEDLLFVRQSDYSCILIDMLSEYPEISECNKLEQYTGIKDINDKEIYEGDIVKGYCHAPNKIFFVKFYVSKYSCGFVATDNKESNPHVKLWYKGFEVIGNIHENKDLLK